MSYASFCYDAVRLRVECCCLMSVCILFEMYLMAWFVFVCVCACVCVSVMLCVCVVFGKLNVYCCELSVICGVRCCAVCVSLCVCV